VCKNWVLDIACGSDESNDERMEKFLNKTLRNFNSPTNNIMDTSLKRDGTCGTKGDEIFVWNFKRKTGGKRLTGRLKLVLGARDGAVG